MFGIKGRQAEIDLVVASDMACLVDVKGYAKLNDAVDFAGRARFCAKMPGLAEGKWEAVLMAGDRADGVEAICRENGITLA